MTTCPHCGEVINPQPHKPEIGDAVSVIWPHEGRMNGYIRSVDWDDRTARVVVDDGRIIDVPHYGLSDPT